MFWFSTSIVSYFLSAIAALADKFLLKRLVPHPAVYAFFVSAMGGVVLLLAPFGFLHLPDAPRLIALLLSGVIFTFGLFFFYAALHRGEASRVAPLTGGLTSVFVLILAAHFLGESLTQNQLLAFLVIVVGSYLVAEEGRGKLSGATVADAVFAALLFASSHVLAKFGYLGHPFLSALVWRGMGGVVGALVLLAFPTNWRHVVRSLAPKQSFGTGQSVRDPAMKTGAVFMGGQACAALGFFLMNYAFALGSVSLVSALSGMQYVFLFLMALALSARFPEVLRESLAPSAVRKKFVSIALIAVGVGFLFL